MSTTRIQNLLLQRYKAYRDNPPTLGRLVQQSWRGEAVLIAASAVGAWYLYSLHLYGMACFVVGLLIGALARDLGTFLRVLLV